MLNHQISFNYLYSDNVNVVAHGGNGLKRLAVKGNMIECPSIAPKSFPSHYGMR